MSHLTPCIHAKYKLHYTNSLSAAVSEPAVYRLIKFHVPNLMSHISLLISYLSIDSGPRQVFMFCNKDNFTVRISPNPQVGGTPPVGCPQLLIKYICSYPPHRRPLLYTQPEEARCRGDRHLLILGFSVNMRHNYHGCLE
jgi:hypothetical protein